MLRQDVGRRGPGQERRDRHERVDRGRNRALVFLAAALLAACGSRSPIQPSQPLPPTITCPIDQSLTSPDGRPVEVLFPAPIVMNGSGPLSISCSPSAGTLFVAGTTPVTCTATDAIQRAATCTFSVKIAMPPRLRFTRFLSFGDSITWGVLVRVPRRSGGLGPEASYASQLLPMLQERYTSQTIELVNEGLPGESAEEGARRLPGVLAENRPEVVLLMEGANDINTLGSDAVPFVADAMGEMIRESRAAGAEVLLGTLPPQRPGGFRAPNAEVVPELNARLKELATELGVPVVDIYAAFGGEPGDLIDWDGLHPTKAGYLRMAEAFFGGIKASFESAPAMLVSRPSSFVVDAPRPSPSGLGGPGRSPARTESSPLAAEGVRSRSSR